MCWLQSKPKTIFYLWKNMTISWLWDDLIRIQCKCDMFVLSTIPHVIPPFRDPGVPFNPMEWFWHGFAICFFAHAQNDFSFLFALEDFRNKKKRQKCSFHVSLFSLIRKLYHKQTLKKGFVCVVKKHRKNCDFLFFNIFFFRNLILSPITFLHISIVCMYWSRHHREGGMMGGKKTVFRD